MLLTISNEVAIHDCDYMLCTHTYELEILFTGAVFYFPR